MKPVSKNENVLSIIGFAGRIRSIMGLRGSNTPTLSSGQAVRFLVAVIGPTHLAFPALWVRGILTPAETGPEGLVTWANSYYEMTDLAGRLALGRQMVTGETRLVLYGNEAKLRSFTVDKVLGLVDVNRAQIHPLPTQFRGGERDRLLGFFLDATYVALIGNPFWVLEIPVRKNALEAFILQASDRRVGASDSGLRLAPTVLKDVAPVSAGPVR